MTSAENWSRGNSTTFSIWQSSIWKLTGLFKRFALIFIVISFPLPYGR